MYRDNLEAAHQRIKELEIENKRLKSVPETKEEVMEIIFSKLHSLNPSLDTTPGANIRNLVEAIVEGVMKVNSKSGNPSGVRLVNPIRKNGGGRRKE